MRAMATFQNRTVVLCVGGGIAAYKACDLARRIVKGGGSVRVAMTPAATRFVGPLTFQALTGAPVLTDLLDPQADLVYGHLALARAADLVIVAPATADLLARIRAGMADDAVTTTVLAATCPILLAPAMNTRMWRNPAVGENVAALRARGMQVVGPASGELADGDVGEGLPGSWGASTSPAARCSSPLVPPASRSTRCGSSRIPPPGRWATRSRGWRRGAAPR
jgi:phosphopantothenoylcysteine decarboxylase / phosphopantothenate---cysteine ligase